MSTVFYTLAVLACPVAMGLMMFMMMRGQSKGSTDRGEVEALRAEIKALKADRTTQTPEKP
jgi:lysophospholipid acyltransferase (LPLAT)-like uncharacterized protein